MSDQRLRRSLTLLDAVAIVAGSMIGSGIFLKAQGIAERIPHPPFILLIWLAAGLLTLGGALVMAELGAMMPEAGGIYVYLRRAYGPFAGFLFGWSLLAVLQTGSIAGLAAGAMQSLSDLAPGIKDGHTRFYLAALLIVMLTSLNVISVKSGARVQNLLTGAKVLGIGGLVLGALCMGEASTTNFTPAAPLATAGLLGALGICITKALWAYDGWCNLGFMAGELKEPQRNLPRAVAIGVGLVIVVYVLTNAAYHFVLPMDVVQHSNSAAVAVARRLLGSPGTLTMSILTFVSMAGALNSSILSAPRVYYAMAQDGKFPRKLAAVHATFRTPYVSLILQGGWSIVLLIWWGAFEKLTDNVVFIYWIFYALSAGAVLRLRASEPHTHRPYKSVGYPLVPVVFIVAAVLLTANTMIQAPRQSAQALILVITGAALYPLFNGPPLEAGADEPDSADPFEDDEDQELLLPPSLR
jgi:APA family basic amino acid/polyamine antiporter